MHQLMQNKIFFFLHDSQKLLLKLEKVQNYLFLARTEALQEKSPAPFSGLNAHQKFEI